MIKILIVLLSTVPAVWADEIYMVETGSGEISYVVNCSGSCTVRLYTLDGLLAAESNHSGFDWGAISGIEVGRYNLTLWASSSLVDQMTVNMGVFEQDFTEKVNTRLGKQAVGMALLLGVAISGVLLGFEGGMLATAVALLVVADQGYAPGWLIYIVYLVAALLGGIGLYSLVGGLK
jgi:hypothetical protein